MSHKVDYQKQFPDIYKPSAKKCSVVNVPAMNYLMVDGYGNPNESAKFQSACEMLFSVSYALKFAIKKSPLQIDYRVYPLEGLWWTDNMEDFDINNKDIWKWTLMIAQPEWIDKDLVETQISIVEKKKKISLEQLRFEEFHEGNTAQIMHIGPFSEEGPTVQKLHDFIRSKGGVRTGLHHEIYLSDIRRAKPENWKTIIRQPFQE